MALRQRLVRGQVAGITVLVMVLTACSASSAAPERSTGASVSANAAAVSPLVGRWMQVHTCD